MTLEYLEFIETPPLVLELSSAVTEHVVIDSIDPHKVSTSIYVEVSETE